MYALDIGIRYLRSKKRSTVSAITFIAVGGVALGVAALLSVLSITSGFQDAFRNKVLGVNAHVLVLKYGLDFEEYRDVIARANEMPEVAGAAPFVINEMMLSHGDRLSGVLVKGIDPELMPSVLDLPDHIVDGSLDGLRLPTSLPPIDPNQLGAGGDDGLDEYLRGVAAQDPNLAGLDPDGLDPDGLDPDGLGTDGLDPGGLGTDADPDVELTPEEEEALRQLIADSNGRAPLFEGPADGEEPGGSDEDGELATSEDAIEPLPIVEVPTPEEVEQALRELGEGEGLPTDREEESLFEDEEFLPDDAIATDDLPGIVVGATLARNLDLVVGDRVQVISPLAGLDTSMWSAETRTPRSREFRVIAVFEAGFQEYDSRLVYVDLYEAQRFFDHGDTVTGVEMRLHDLELAPAIADQLERELGGGPFHTMDWEELNHNLFTALAIQKIMLSLVIANIIVVAALNVIATLIMIVLEKKREIAILKAMGAKDFSILGIFMLQGTIIGLVGTLIGLVLGGAVVAYLSVYEFPLDPKVYLIDHLPVRVSLWEFVITTVVALGICMAATIAPSWWATRLLPADGVRYE